MNQNLPDVSAQWEMEMKSREVQEPPKPHRAKVKSVASRELGGRY